MSMYNPNQVDQMAESIDQQVQSAKRRPVLFGIVALGIVVFGVWYMTGGSAVGSPHQAEQLILTGHDGYTAQTVHCTQDGQSLLARIRGLATGGRTSTMNGQSTDPLTYYTCSGTTTSGQPGYWCVAYPPRGNQYATPVVSARVEDQRCS